MRSPTGSKMESKSGPAGHYETNHIVRQYPAMNALPRIISFSEPVKHAKFFSRRTSTVRPMASRDRVLLLRGVPGSRSPEQARPRLAHCRPTVRPSPRARLFPPDCPGPGLLTWPEGLSIPITAPTGGRGGARPGGCGERGILAYPPARRKGGGSRNASNTGEIRVGHSGPSNWRGYKMPSSWLN